MMKAWAAVQRSHIRILNHEKTLARRLNDRATKGDRLPYRADGDTINPGLSIWGHDTILIPEIRNLIESETKNLNRLIKIYEQRKSKYDNCQKNIDPRCFCCPIPVTERNLCTGGS